MNLNRPTSLLKGKDMSAANKPSNAFIGASWTALLLGAGAYMVALWGAQMALNEKGFYFVLLMYGLFSAVSLQKCVRDKMEGLRVTSMYYGLCWFSIILVGTMMAVGLWNATLMPMEKGFYAMAFALGLFGAVAVQKNTRDTAFE